MHNRHSEVGSRVPSSLEAITRAPGFTQSKMEVLKMLENKEIHVSHSFSMRPDCWVTRMEGRKTCLKKICILAFLGNSYLWFLPGNSNETGWMRLDLGVLKGRLDKSRNDLNVRCQKEETKVVMASLLVKEVFG